MATVGPTGGTQPRPSTPYPRAKTPYQRTPGMGQPMPKPYTTPNIPGQIRPRMLATPQQGISLGKWKTFFLALNDSLSYFKISIK